MTADGLDILRSKAFAQIAVVDRKGRPHVSPVWVDVDGAGLIVINTAEGRVKASLLTVGTPVAVCALHPENPYRYVLVRGHVVSRSAEGAEGAIHALSRKYTGVDFRIPDGQQRLTILIHPDLIVGYPPPD